MGLHGFGGGVGVVSLSSTLSSGDLIRYAPMCVRSEVQRTAVAACHVMPTARPAPAESVPSRTEIQNPMRHFFQVVAMSVLPFVDIPLGMLFGVLFERQLDLDLPVAAHEVGGDDARDQRHHAQEDFNFRQPGSETTKGE